MSRVYVTNNSGHDFSSAEQHGELEYITEGSIDKFKVNHMYRVCVEAFEKSEPNDFILITGLTLINVIATSVFAYKHGQLNILIYDAKENDYVVRNIMLGNLID